MPLETVPHKHETVGGEETNDFPRQAKCRLADRNENVRLEPLVQATIEAPPDLFTNECCEELSKNFRLALE